MFVRRIISASRRVGLYAFVLCGLLCLRLFGGATAVAQRVDDKTDITRPVTFPQVLPDGVKACSGFRQIVFGPFASQELQKYDYRVCVVFYYGTTTPVSGDIYFQPQEPGSNTWVDPNSSDFATKYPGLAEANKVFNKMLAGQDGFKIEKVPEPTGGTPAGTDFHPKNWRYMTFRFRSTTKGLPPNIVVRLVNLNNVCFLGIEQVKIGADEEDPNASIEHKVTYNWGENPIARTGMQPLVGWNMKGYYDPRVKLSYKKPKSRSVPLLDPAKGNLGSTATPLIVCKNDTIILDAHVSGYCTSAPCSGTGDPEKPFNAADDHFKYKWEPFEGHKGYWIEKIGSTTKIHPIPIDGYTAVYENINAAKTIRVVREGMCNIVASAQVNVGSVDRPHLSILEVLNNGVKEGKALPPAVCGEYNPVLKVKALGAKTVRFKYKDEQKPLTEDPVLVYEATVTGDMADNTATPYNITERARRKDRNGILDSIIVEAAINECVDKVAFPLAVYPVVSVPDLEILNKDTNTPYTGDELEICSGVPLDVAWKNGDEIKDGGAVVKIWSLGQVPGADADTKTTTKDDKDFTWNTIGSNDRESLKLLNLSYKKWRHAVKFMVEEQHNGYRASKTNLVGKTCRAEKTRYINVLRGVIANFSMEVRNAPSSCVGENTEVFLNPDKTQGNMSPTNTYEWVYWHGLEGDQFPATYEDATKAPTENKQTYTTVIGTNKGQWTHSVKATGPTPPAFVLLPGEKAKYYMKANGVGGCPDWTEQVLPLHAAPSATIAEVANSAFNEHCSPRSMEFEVKDVKGVTHYWWKRKLIKEWNAQTGAWEDPKAATAEETLGNKNEVKKGAKLIPNKTLVFDNPTTHAQKYEVILELFNDYCETRKVHEVEVQGVVSASIDVESSKCPDWQDASGKWLANFTLRDLSTYGDAATAKRTWYMREANQNPPAAWTVVDASSPDYRVEPDGGTTGQFRVIVPPAPVDPTKNDYKVRDVELKLEVEEHSCKVESKPVKSLKIFPPYHPAFTIEYASTVDATTFTTMSSNPGQTFCGPIFVKMKGTGASILHWAIRYKAPSDPDWKLLNNFTGSEPGKDNAIKLGNETGDCLVYRIELVGSTAVGQCKSPEVVQELTVYPELYPELSLKVLDQCHPLKVEVTDESKTFRVAQKDIFVTWKGYNPALPGADVGTVEEFWRNGKKETFINGSAGTGGKARYVFSKDADEERRVSISVQYADRLGGSRCAKRAETESVKLYEKLKVSITPNPKVVCSGSPIHFDFTRTGTSGTNEPLTVWYKGVKGGAPKVEPALSSDHVYENLGVKPVSYPVKVQATKTIKAVDGMRTCKASAEATVTVYPKPEARYSIKAKEICAKDNGCDVYEVTMFSETTENYEWTFTTANSTDGKTVTYKGKQQYKVGASGALEPKPVTVQLKNTSENQDVVYTVSYKGSKFYSGKECALPTVTDIPKIIVKPKVVQKVKGIPASICSGVSVEFADASLGGEVTSIWTFPSHTQKKKTEAGWDKVNNAKRTEKFPMAFANHGTEDRVLSIQVVTIQDGTQCQDAGKPLEVVVHPQVNAQFNLNVKEICAWPLVVGVSNKSVVGTTSSPKTTYTWNFDNKGVTSKPDKMVTHDKADFEHKFWNNKVDGDETREVHLKVLQEYLDGSRCEGETTRELQGIRPKLKPDFTMSDEHGNELKYGCMPLKVVFESKGTGGDANKLGVSYSWDFGDNANPPVLMPGGNGKVDHTYNFPNLLKPETRPVTLTAMRKRSDGGKDCSVSITKDILLLPVVKAEFTTDQTRYCTPAEAEIKNLSKNATDFEWTIRTNTTKTTVSDPNPFKLPLAGSSATEKVKLSLKAFSTYDVSTTPKVSQECASLFDVDLTLYPTLQAKFEPSGAKGYEGCAPYALKLDNLSAGEATEYIWYVDGSETKRFKGVSADKANLEYTFLNKNQDFSSRDYTVVLKAVNGICSKNFEKKIKVYPEVQNTMNLSAVEVCAPQKISGKVGKSSKELDYVWKVTRPSIAGVFEEKGEILHDVTFENKTKNPPTVQQGEIALVTSLKAYPTCQTKVTQQIVIYPQVYIDFKIPNPDCSGKDFLFANTTDSYEKNFMPAGAVEPTQSLTEYTWSLGTFKSYERNPTFKLSYDKSEGSTSYEVILEAKSAHGCVGEKVTKKVTVLANPKAEVRIVGESSGCPGTEIQFESKAQGDGIEYSYSLKDGTKLGGPFKQATQTMFKYPFPNRTKDPIGYDVIQKVVSHPAGMGVTCESQAMTKVTIFPGLPSIDKDVVMDPPAGCSRLEVNIKHKVPGAKYYTLVFKDTKKPLTPPTPNEETVYTFTNDTEQDVRYEVEVTAETSNGCRSTTVKEVEVFATPVPEFDVIPHQQVFPNDVVKIVNKTTPKADAPSDLWKYSWDFGNGETFDGKDPAPYDYDRWGSEDSYLEVKRPDGSTEKKATPFAFHIKLVAENPKHPACKAEMIHSATILPPVPVVKFSPESTEGCVPMTVIMKNSTKHAEVFAWDFGDGSEIVTSRDPVHVYRKPGIYNVTLTADGPGGSDKKYGIFVAHGKPRIRFRIVPDTVMIPNARVKAQNETTEWDGEPLKDGAQYFWDFGDPTNKLDQGLSMEPAPVHEFFKVGEYFVKLRVISSVGCVNDSLATTPIVVKPQGWIRFPNAFSPLMAGDNNGYYVEDSENNTIFYPQAYGITDYHLVIFDRWGTQIFETHDIHQGWDGTRGGKPCPVGVYGWRATGHFDNGQIFDQRGNLTLLR